MGEAKSSEGYKGGSYDQKSEAGNGPADKEYQKAIKKLLAHLGIEPEDEEQPPWMMAGFPPGYVPLSRTRQQEMGMYRSPILLDNGGPLTARGLSSAMQGYKSPMSSTQLNRNNTYVDRGHSIDINLQYTTPEGGRYNANFKTGADNAGQAMYSALLGFYAMVASDAKEGGYNSGRGKLSGKSSTYGGRGSYAGGKSGSYAGGNGGGGGK